MEQDLNRVIDELAKINTKAAEYVQNMENSKTKLMEDQQLDKDRFAQMVRSRAEERLEAEKQQLQADNDKRIASMREHNEDYVSRLERSYSENHETWAKEIAGKIISELL